MRGSDLGVFTACVRPVSAGRWTSALFVTVLFTGCGEEAAPSIAEGERIYRSRVDDGNSFTCETCHALEEPSADGVRRAGHPIGDAANRPSYKAGTISEMREAVNSCLDHWMRAEPWAENDRRWSSLELFLQDQAGAGQSAPLSYEIVDPPDVLTGGDGVAGRALFNESCALCHGPDGEGTDRAIPLQGRAEDLEPDYVAERVRLSGPLDTTIYPGLTQPTVMPFWSASRLSDDELRDLIAFVSDPTLNGGDGDGDGDGDGGGDGDGDGDGDVVGGPGDCPTTHERVGWTADLSTIFHDVDGVATIVNDCSVRIDMFDYDATGIDVAIYGGVGGVYEDGYPMTPDLIRAQPYQGATLWAVLPEGRTLDDLDGVSVWCIDVGVDFGSGTFAPP